MILTLLYIITKRIQNRINNVLFFEKYTQLIQKLNYRRVPRRQNTETKHLFFLLGQHTLTNIIICKPSLLNYTDLFYMI